MLYPPSHLGIISEIAKANMSLGFLPLQFHPVGYRLPINHGAQ